MNFTTAVFLVNRDTRMVSVKYEPDGKLQRFKTLDPSIAVDDLVIVPTSTRFGFTVVKVVAVDIEVDFDDGTLVDWIAARVDLEAYRLLAEQEAVMVKTVREAEAKRKRDELAATLMAAGGDALKALPFVKQ
jgi:hypothetical protein